MPDTDKQLSIAHEAAQQVENRRKVYGNPKPNFDRIADWWNTYWRQRTAARPDGEEDMPFDAIDVATMMRLVKEARLIETPDHRDSLVDIAGYADCHWEVVRK